MLVQERSLGVDAQAEAPWRRATVLRAVRRYPRSAEVAVVVLVSAVLQAVLFRSFYSGAGTPEWDFLSHYTVDAHAWWRDGGFFDAHDWVPYLWGGFPGTLDLQNSSWYLPVGLSYLLTGYDVHAAAILAALHVAFGGLGIYVLVRRHAVPPSVALFALTTWTFASGFFANASHPDIARAYAWLPWVLLCASTAWRWGRWWAPLVATLVFWQALLGMYPGIVVGTVYVVGVWVLVQQLTVRPRLTSYLVPLAVSVVLAGLLTAPRFYTAFLVRGAGDPSVTTSDVWSWRLLGTLLYPYGSNEIPNDITMRSFFLPATVFALVWFGRGRSLLVRCGAAMAAVAFVLGMPLSPFQDVALLLPGLDVSRLRMSDFRVFLLLGLVLLATAGLQRVVADRTTVEVRAAAPVSRTGGHARLPVVGGAAVLLGMAALGFAGPFDFTDWTVQWSFLVVALALALLARTALDGTQLRAVVAVLVALSCFSGVIWAFSTTKPWLVSRPVMEQLYFGAQVEDMIDARQPVGPLERRPARSDSLLTAEDYRDRWPTTDALRALYERGYGLSGYVNLKGTPTFVAIQQSLADPATSADARAFWTAPGLVISSESGEVPPAASSEECAETGRCGDLTVEPVAFEDGSTFRYDVRTETAGEVSFNEAFYEGWTLGACSPEGDCTDLAVRSGVGGQVVADVPAGDWSLALRYRLPGVATAWALAAAGLVGAVGWSAAILVRPRVRARRS